MKTTKHLSTHIPNLHALRTSGREYVNPVDYRHPYDSMARFAALLSPLPTAHAPLGLPALTRTLTRSACLAPAPAGSTPTPPLVRMTTAPAKQIPSGRRSAVVFMAGESGRKGQTVLLAVSLLSHPSRRGRGSSSMHPSPAWNPGSKRLPKNLLNALRPLFTPTQAP
jgi:hypothetical protein